MCMITFLPEGVEADDQAIFNGALFNDDGHGFAIVINGELVVRRGFDSAEMVDLFVSLRRTHPEGPAMFHSRMATHGVTDKSNVHPFYVGSDRRTVLVHNGIFATLGTKKGTTWSDTKIFARSFLPSRADMNILTRRGRIRAQKWMGSYNKVAVITTNPNSKLSSFILNENEGYWDSSGAWYSGLDYLGSKYHYSKSTAYAFEDYGFDRFEDRSRPAVLGSTGKEVAMHDSQWDEYWTEYVAEHGRCGFCEAVGSIDIKTGVCAVCTMCNDCRQPEKFCACF